MPYVNPALRFAAIALCSLCFSIAHAATFSAKVVGIADGDTLTVLNNEKQEVKIRLSEIDAPEAHQAFGSRSKQSLSDLCFGQQAEIITQTKDRYKRTVGRVKCSGVDVNTEQVNRGMPWVYPQYAKDQNLYIHQSDAKLARRGLWIDPSPIPPWEFRKLKRHASHHQ
jgi:endonuclease YncB( thermonuclease family)